PALRPHGLLRILTTGRQGDGRLHPDQALLERLAAELELIPVWIEMPDTQSLLQALRDGRGDLIADPAATELPEAEDIARSKPLRHHRPLLVSRRGRTLPASPDRLKDVSILLPAGSPLRAALEARARDQGLRLVSAPPGTTDQELLSQVHQGRHDLAAMEEEKLRRLLPSWPDLTVAMELEEVNDSWLIRASARELKQAVDAFLLRNAGATLTAGRHFEDFSGILQRGVLRVVATPGNRVFLLRKGLPAGFAYELLRRFTEKHGLRIQLSLESDPARQLHLLAEGLADLVLTPIGEVPADRFSQLHLRPRDPELPSLRWTIRRNNPELLTALNGYLSSIDRSEFHNVLAKRYRDGRKARTGEGLSPWDATVREVAGRHHFDWRLVLAQMYQESRFDPAARSDAGAVGLMQLLPETAREMGIADPEDPLQNIEGGVRYLDRLRQAFDGEISVRELNWFALAAYNAGLSRVRRARRMALRMGLDPDRWFGNVELAMVRLGQSGAGCRCGQTVHYVRRIRELYDAYLALDEHRLALAATSRSSGENG
ncbi:MAG: hypothetical protein D6786_00860, partial [Gammaproteobacteria bacterium]